MRRSSETNAGAARNDAIAQWGKICDESLHRYFDATRSLQEAALKSQVALVEAAGQMLVAGNRIVADNIEQLTNGDGGAKPS